MTDNIFRLTFIIFSFLNLRKIANVLMFAGSVNTRQMAVPSTHSMSKHRPLYWIYPISALYFNFTCFIFFFFFVQYIWIFEYFPENDAIKIIMVQSPSFTYLNVEKCKVLTCIVYAIKLNCLGVCVCAVLFTET